MHEPKPNLARLLLAGWRWFDDGLREGLREAGFGDITTTQSMVIPYLTADGIRQADLARRLGMTRQGLQQLTAGLVVKGLVELTPDPTSRRSKLVRLTDRGKDSVEVALASLARVEVVLIKRIGEEKVDQLRLILNHAWPELDGYNDTG